MTREEAIKILKAIRVYECYPKSASEETKEAIDMAIEALSADAVKRVDCSNFLLWLLEEIMDEDNWELNAVADGEIIARKLKKLGLLEVKDGYYHRIFDENVWAVRCKDFIHWQKTNIETIDGHPTYDCPFCGEWADANGFCSFGERREPKGFVADEWYRDTFGENDGK